MLALLISYYTQIFELVSLLFQFSTDSLVALSRVHQIAIIDDMDLINWLQKQRFNQRQLSFLYVEFSCLIIVMRYSKLKQATMTIFWVISIQIDQLSEMINILTLKSSKQITQKIYLMTPEEYQIFKKSLQESQERTAKVLHHLQKMLARIDNTLEGVRDTINKIQENSDNIDKFKKAFGDVMVQLAEKIAGSMTVPFKKVEGKKYEHLPTEIPIKELVQRMMNYKDILIITGAGVSAPSGIPTFRGNNGLYNKKFQYDGVQYEPQQFITKNFYDKHPQPIWQWIQNIYKMAITCKFNKLHELIDKLARTLSLRNKSVTLVTQNIDDLHLKPTKNQYSYYAIHGNVKFVRCDHSHLSPYEEFRDQIAKGKTVKCPKCQLQIRPHVLFFDESYGPLYGQEIKQKQFPFVIVIGSSLSTGLCTKLTMKGIQVVEINPQPVIEIGRVYQYKQDGTLTLAKILKQLGQAK